MKLSGIIPPVVTPMAADQEVDLAGLRRQIDFQIGHGVHGIFVLGTTGEFYALDEAEKQAVVAAAVGHVTGRLPVFAGTGAETTREVVRLTRMAEKEGASGVSVITPYFIKPTQAELYDHFRRVAESTALPVVLYNNPATCGGLSIEPETVARLAEVPNIVGIKDSSGDLQNTIEILRCTPRDSFAVLNGRDTLILAALAAGAAGAIPASATSPRSCASASTSRSSRATSKRPRAFSRGCTRSARRWRWGRGTGRSRRRWPCSVGRRARTATPSPRSPRRSGRSCG